MLESCDPNVCKRLVYALSRLRWMDWYQAGGEESDLKWLIELLRDQDAQCAESNVGSSDTSSNTF